MTDSKQLEQQALEAFKQRDRNAAGRHLRALMKAEENTQGAWSSLSRLAMVCGEANAAVDFARRASVQTIDKSDFLIEYAAILAQTHHMDEALETALRAVGKDPKNAAAHHLAGTLFSQMGDQEKAAQHFRLALDQAELSGKTWLALAMIKTFGDHDPDLARMQMLKERATKTDPENRGAFLYALGKALIDTGDDEGGFAALDDGASAVRGARSYDARNDKVFADQLIAGFDGKAADALSPSHASSERPIFVTGLPRSGTTLIEQILASHSEVAGGGELNLLATAMMPAGPPTLSYASGYQERTGADVWTDIGETYLRMLSERFGESGRVIDKTLTHSRYIGLIRHIFPDAPIVWVTRSAGDTALSNYRTFFTGGVPWSWSWQDIATHFKCEDALFAHWEALYPDTILTVPYEQLVADPEQWIPKILSHCGLKDEAATRDFDKTKRAVTTASTLQVRQPITPAAIGGAERFADQMAPFFKAYDT